MYENTIYNSTNYSKSKEWGELKAEKEIEINKVRFKQLLCKIGKNNVVETNKGIAILDIAKYIPLMKQFPEITIQQIHRFKTYFTDSPADNHNHALYRLDP